MADRHKHNPLTFRPSEHDRERLTAYAKRTGEPLRRIVAQALTRFLDAAEGVTTSGDTAPANRRRTTARASKPPLVAAKTAQQSTEQPVKHRCPVKGWCADCGEMKGPKR